MSSRELNIIIRVKNLAGAAISGVKRELGGIQKDVGRGLKNAGRNIERGLMITGAAAVGGLTLAIKTAAEFEDAFAGVRKTIDETELAAAGLSFDHLMDQFREMARTMPIAFEDLAAIGEQAGALGIRADDIAAFTEVAAKLGVTTDLSSDQAADALGHLGVILGLTGEEYEDLADSLVNLGNKGASTESQIIGIAERFAASGKAAGLSKEEILALSSTMASMGVEVEAAGSSLSRTFDSITTNIATGNSKARALAEALGMSASELKKAWKQDAIGTFQELLGVLDGLDKYDAAKLLKELGVTGVRDIRALRLLSKGWKNVEKDINNAKAAQGALDEEAAKKFATTASKWKTFQNILRDVGYVIGKEVLPIVNELLDDFADFMAKPSSQRALKDFARNLADGIRDAVEWFRKLDWDKIAGTLKTLVDVGKGLVEGFLSLPSWVQGAIATGWGLNKLTGGALGSIFGHLASGLIKGILNMNAGVVNINAASVRGLPGGPGAGGRPVAPPPGAAPPGLLAPGLGTLGAGIALPFLMFNVIPELFKTKGATPITASRTLDDGTVVELGPQATAMMTGLMPSFRQSVVETGGRITRELDKVYGGVTDVDLGIDKAREDVRDLNDPLGTLADLERQMKADAKAADAAMLGSLRTVKQAQDNARTQAARQHSRAIDRQNAQIARLDRLNAKEWRNVNVNKVTTNVGVTANIAVSASSIAQSLRIQQAASQTTFVGRGGESRY